MTTEALDFYAYWNGAQVADLWTTLALITGTDDYRSLLLCVALFGLICAAAGAAVRYRGGDIIVWIAAMVFIFSHQCRWQSDIRRRICERKQFSGDWRRRPIHHQHQLHQFRDHRKRGSPQAELWVNPGPGGGVAPRQRARARMLVSDSCLLRGCGNVDERSERSRPGAYRGGRLRPSICRVRP